MTRARAAASPAAVDAVVLTAMIAGALALYHALATPFVLDVDVVNLALGSERFDVAQHQPQPPGYLGYVLVLRLVHALTRLDRVAIAELVAAAMAAGTIALTWLAARRFAPADRAAARWAAAFAAAHPILLYYGVDGQTHAAEALMAAALLAVLPVERARAGVRDAVVVGAVIAAGGSLRPSFALFVLAPAVWALGFDARRLAVCGAVAAAGTVAWLWPTVALSGGWRAYRVASDALIGGFAGVISPMSSRSVARLTADNARKTLVWTALAIAPALLALAARSLAARSLAAAPRALAPPSALRRAVVLLAMMTAPAFAFFALVFCAEAGYLAALVPIAALTAALALAGGPRALRAAAVALVAAELGFFLVGPERSFMLPTAGEIAKRQLLAETLLARITDDTAPGARLLVVSDEPDNTILRQLPLLRPPLDVLFVHAKERFALGGRSSMSLATAHDWRAVPGPALDAPGDARVLAAPHAYDVVVVDPRSSDALWHQLAAQSRCPLPPKDSEMHAPHLSPACFAGSALELSDEDYRFELAR